MTTPNPDVLSPAAMAALYEATLKIADMKMAEVTEALRQSPSPIALKPRIATGGGFAGIFLWDTAFAVFWAKHEPKRYPVTESLDNFYTLQDADGFICREYQADGRAFWNRRHPASFAPPLLAWAELEIFDAGITDVSRLARVFDPLLRQHAFCRRMYRRPDGLYFGDALGCGMDDLPRTPVDVPFTYDGGIDFSENDIEDGAKWFWKHIEGNPSFRWNRQLGWIDMSAQMAFNASNLARIATLVGRDDEVAALRSQHAELAQLINTKCYDEKRGFYFDHYDGAIVPRYHAGSFWVLIADIVPPERLARFVTVLRDPAKFNRPVPVPALSADDPDYAPETGYWRGSVWPPTTYMLLRGLRKVGEEELAKDFARRNYAAHAALYRATGTVWENISPEQCERPKAHSGRDFCGWSALTPIAIAKEFLA
jgi:hypothetical protein